MHPDPSESIEHLIRPLEHNAEIHLAARCYLLEQMEKAGGVEDKVAAFVKTRESGMPQRGASPRAVTSAATQAPGAHPKPWRGWFYLAVVALVVACVLPPAWQVCNGGRLGHGLLPGRTFASKTPRHPRMIQNLPQKDKLLLLGDDSLASLGHDRWKSLWQTEPENPVFLAQHAKSFDSRKPVPGEILEAAGRIDPDNALYPLLQATHSLDSVIESKSPTRLKKKAGKRKEWIIKDAAALDERIALIHRAAAMPAIRGYEGPFRARQRAVLPPPDDLSSAFQQFSYLSYDNARISILSVSKLLAAKASQCAEQGDATGFHAVVSDWKSLCAMFVRDGSGFLDALVTRAMLSQPLEDFHDAAVKLGLEEEARRFKEFDQYFKQMKLDEKKRSGAGDPICDLVDQKGSIFFSLSAVLVRSKVTNPTPISADDLRPGRYADHALLGRILTLAAALVFLLLAGAAALCRFRQSALVRGLSSCVPGLLRVSDCAWIIGLGALAPTSWFLTIQFFTPFGAREWSLRYANAIPTVAQFGAAVLLVATATLVTAGWRLGVRGGPLNLRRKRPWVGRLMTILLVFAIPATGMLPAWPPTQSETGLKLALGVLLGPPILWLGVSLLLNLINRADESLRRACHARLMIPAWMFTAAVFAALAPVYHQSEKYWFKNDHLSGLADPAVEFTRYETVLSKVFHDELRELMDKYL